MRERKSQAQSRAEDRILAITSGAGRRTRRRSPVEAPSVFQQLLSEVSDPVKLEERPLKRRRVGESSRAQPIEVDDDEPADDLFEDVPLTTESSKHPQTVTDSEHSDDDDFDEWEEVGASTAATTGEGEVGDVSIEVKPDTSTPKKSRRRPLTATDRTIALATHKCHVLFLLFHAHVRNRWSSISSVECSLRGILSAKIIGMLNPDTNWVQLRQSESFLEGLKQAVDIWSKRFKVTAFGLHRAKWVLPEELDELRDKITADGEVLEKAGFIKAAKARAGSQDLGNQLFCALLRAVGVEARLVCSLQTLPPSTTIQRTVTPQKNKPVKPRIYATFEHDEETSTSEDSKALNSDAPLSSRRRLGHPVQGGPVGSYHHVPASGPKKRTRRLEYPVFWVEALNPAYQKWVPVDPIVTGTVNKATKLEPPASYESNAMSYVIAFEEDGHAKDVTRRYAKAFNAKTRKQRVESFAEGQRWYNGALKSFLRSVQMDRDQIEDAELARKEAQEGLPGSIQDFKDHPHYALERHLKRNEVIHPKREVGKINTGKSSASNLEPIYRRKDVQLVQSADKWYRQGREIKAGEQPLKHVPSRSRRARSPMSDDGEPEMAALYAYHQTVSYIPPPVVRGKVPKNVYGNIDIYVPTMIPAGGSHIKHPLAKKAAQLLNVDYAEAVTGFQFKGRHGTAVVQGIIVATVNKDAVEAAIQGFLDAQQQTEEDARSLECLRLWRRFLLGLQIADRIGLTDIHAANAEQAKDFKQELDEAEDESVEVVDAGGFFPDSGADDVARPTGHLFDSHVPSPLRRAQEASSPPPHPTMNLAQRGRLRKRRMIEDDDEDEPAYDPRPAVADVTPAREQDGPDQGPPRVSERVVRASTTPHGQMDVPSNVDETNDTGGGFMVGDNTVDSGASIAEPRETQGRRNLRDESGEQSELLEYEDHEDDGFAGGFEPEASEAADDMAMESARPGVPAPLQTGQVGATDSERGDIGRAIPAVEDEELADADETELDRESLLSHDPEDEDADPDWLDGD
ncbi:hypothetical protein CAC42_2305 [Sphaceloma murrayae]|uniref:DNA repair protein rhp41 n=1 Tax=Sphaceloma murrayae TaxID=2082308 RepID=A0A2K1QIV6_9PEZI|nr:hypothetical protein CAC42_2305 [Sphaceloma murrayae]